MELAGKVALVTGASKGIGRGIALALAQAGADVCVNYRSPGPAGPETAAAIQAMGRRALAVQADVSDRAASSGCWRSARRGSGPWTSAWPTPCWSVRADPAGDANEDLQRALEVGVLGTFHFLQVVARQMVARKARGILIYISSPHARLPFKGAVDYNTAKAGATCWP